MFSKVLEHYISAYAYVQDVSHKSNKFSKRLKQALTNKLLKNIYFYIYKNRNSKIRLLKNNLKYHNQTFDLIFKANLFVWKIFEIFYFHKIFTTNSSSQLLLVLVYISLELFFCSPVTTYYSGFVVKIL